MVRKVIRSTKSICSICCQQIPAKIVRSNGKIIMEKECPQHGDLSFVLSSDSDYFEQLSEAYFAILPKGLPLKILELSLTSRCDLSCPICSVMRSIGNRTTDLTKDDIKKIIKEHPDKEVILWGMEPTENNQLVEILQLLKVNNKQPFLFTNGQKIADLDYLKKLKQAGLTHVYLQFDGFNDDIYKILRQQPLLSNKIAALKNLKQLNIPTTFNTTLAKGVNEDQITKIIDYAVENSDFVKQIGFLPLIKIGGADEYKQDLIPEFQEFLRIIERETKGRINCANLRAFQKLMYVIYRYAKFRRCFWFTLYILVKNKNGAGYKTIDQLINLPKIEKAIDQYVQVIKLKGGACFFANLRLIFKLAIQTVNFNTLPLCLNGLKFFLFGKHLEDARSGSQRLIFITCTDFCDLYKMDLDMSDNYCEELLAVKDKTGKVNYQYTYRMMIEGSKRAK